jgi:hypothetical protein
MRLALSNGDASRAFLRSRQTISEAPRHGLRAMCTRAHRAQWAVRITVRA